MRAKLLFIAGFALLALSVWLGQPPRADDSLLLGIQLTSQRHIGTPVMIVAGASSNFNSGSSSGAITTVDAPIGSLVIMGIGNVSSNNTISSLSDSAGNTWHVIQSTATTNVPNGGIAWTITTADLPVNSSFTASTTGGQWNFDGIWKVANAIGGLDISQNGVVTGASTGISQSTGALAVGFEIIFGQVTIQSSITYTESSNFTNLVGAGASSNGGIGYKIVFNSASSITYAPSWTSGSNLSWQLASFKATP